MKFNKGLSSDEDLNPEKIKRNKQLIQLFILIVALGVFLVCFIVFISNSNIARTKTDHSHDITGTVIEALDESARTRTRLDGTEIESVALGDTDIVRQDDIEDLISELRKDVNEFKKELTALRKIIRIQGSNEFNTDSELLRRITELDTEIQHLKDHKDLSLDTSEKE